MSTQPINDTWKNQHDKIVRSTFKKAYVNAVHASSRTVDVYFIENPQTIIRNIPVAGTVSIAAVLVGARCRIDIFDETNPNDMVMAYFY